MTTLNKTARKGFTHIDVLIALAILVISILGTSVYQYQAELNAHKADVQATAVRTAALLCVGWSGEDGVTAFDPVGTFGADLSITASSGPSAPSGFTSLGSYRVVIDNFYYFATLSYKDLSGAKVRALNVVISWERACHGAKELTAANATYQMTTYVRKPT